MNICLIDNYDSFTYNVEHLLKTQDVQVELIRNDQISVDEAVKKINAELAKF